MATILLPSDFKEFLKLLNSRAVEYLVVGGYAVNYYGYPRATGALDAARVAGVLNEFGFSQAGAEAFLNPSTIVRMGVPPLRIEILTSISGVAFSECFDRRLVTEIDGVRVNLIDADSLKINKRAAGRLKDLADLEELP
jgi:predicted nucleotidyltransferase